MKRRFTLLLGAFLLPAPAFALDSIQLTDVVKSNGTGSIDFLKDVTPASLEAFRQEGAGSLLLAIDVNEAASGTEKASSQAITLKSVVVSVTVGGTTTDYAVYETATQAIVASVGTTQRTAYYTVIGDAGSNRITSNSFQSKFDGVLTISIGQDLSAATAVTAEIVFLDTNVSLGDPEAFYDFSNGFEDLALLNQVDADFLEVLAPGRDEAPTVILTNPPVVLDLVPAAWVSSPSGTGFYTVGYEDLFPALGDYDFNDLLVSYRINQGFNQAGELVEINGVSFLITRVAAQDPLQRRDAQWHAGEGRDRSGRGPAQLLDGVLLWRRRLARILRYARSVPPQQWLQIHQHGAGFDLRPRPPLRVYGHPRRAGPSGFCRRQSVRPLPGRPQYELRSTPPGRDRHPG
jgi:hypothetical protein